MGIRVSCTWVQDDGGSALAANEVEGDERVTNLKVTTNDKPRKISGRGDGAV